MSRNLFGGPAYVVRSGLALDTARLGRISTACTILAALPGDDEHARWLRDYGARCAAAQGWQLGRWLDDGALTPSRVPDLVRATSGCLDEAETARALVATSAWAAARETMRRGEGDAGFGFGESDE